MSRYYAGGTGNRHQAAQVSSAMPFTFAGWVKPSGDVTTEQGLMFLSGGANSGWWIEIFNGNIIAMTSDGANWVFSTKAIQPNRWSHFAGVFTSTTSRTAYVDGVAGTAETTSRTPASATLLGTGVYSDSSSPGNPSLKVQLVDLGYWGTGLSQSEIRQLALGAPSFSVQAGKLVALHFPPNEKRTATQSQNLGFEGWPPLAQFGAVPMVSEYPPLLRRPRPFIDMKAAAAAATAFRLTLMGAG